MKSVLSRRYVAAVLFTLLSTSLPSANAVDLDQPLVGDGRSLRELVTANADLIDHTLRPKLARFGLTLGMSDAEIARYESDPRDPVFTPLRQIALQPHLTMNAETALTSLEGGGVFLVLDFEKMMAREASRQRELRYHRFPRVGPRTMAAIADVLVRRTWSNEPRFDLTRLDLPYLNAGWLIERDLYGVVGEQQLLRAGLKLTEIVRIAEGLENCGQLLATTNGGVPSLVRDDSAD